MRKNRDLEYSIPYYSKRDMVRITIEKINIMKENGTRIREAVGDECTIATGRSTRESGSMTNETVKECIDSVSGKIKIKEILFNLYSLGNDNRYEGSWKDDKKHGSGKFFYLDKGQVYQGTWIDDVPKCGSLEGFDEERASNPPEFPIPVVRID